MGRRVRCYGVNIKREPNQDILRIRADKTNKTMFRENRREYTEKRHVHKET